MVIASGDGRHNMWRSTDRRIPPYGSRERNGGREYRPPPSGPRHRTRPGHHMRWHEHGIQDHPRYPRHPNTHSYSPREEFFRHDRHTPRERWQEEEYVKLCSKCNDFSSNLRSCSNCGQELKESARKFRSPSAVNAKLKDAIEYVSRNQIGPDLKPLLPATSDVLDSIVKSNALKKVLLSPPLFSVTRITAEGPVFVIIPEQRVPRSSSEENSNGPRAALPTDPTVDEPHTIISPSPEIIEILSPSPPANISRDEIKSPVNLNRAESDMTAIKSSKNKKTNQNGRNLLIFIPSDDDEDPQSAQNSKSKEKDSQSAPTIRHDEQEMARKEPPFAEEMPVNLRKKVKRRNKKSSLSENSDDNAESNRKRPSQSADADACDVATATGVCAASSSERISEKPDTSTKDSVRLCHSCDSYSFNLENCSLCSTAFKKKNPQVNSVEKLNTLSKTQLKRVHYTSKPENMTMDFNAQCPSSPSSLPRIRIADVLDHDDADEPNAGEAQELPKDEDEPTLTRGTEEPQTATGLIWEGVTYNDNSFSLINASLILGPNGNPVRSDKSGGVVYVRQCPKCFKFGNDASHCGVCKKKFTKKVPIFRESDLTKKQREESEKRHQEYLAEQLRIENEKIEEKLRRMAYNLHRQKFQKLGLLDENDIAVSVSVVPSSSDDVTNNSRPIDHEGDGKSKPSEDECEPAVKRPNTSF